ALGGVEATKERYRDRRGLPLVDTLRQDHVYAFRTLRKNPSFSAVAIGTLALGIGANTAIFSLVYAVLLRPLPFADPSRLMMVFGTNVERGDQYDVSSYPTFLDWQEQNRSFESMAAFTNRQLVLGAGSDWVLARGKAVTPIVFGVLGVRPALGRAFSESRPGSPDAVVLSAGFWKRAFGSDTGVLGRSKRTNDRMDTIVGVM